MKFLGILRASALFILLSAFHGPRGIFCGNLKVNPSTESSTVEVPEISEKPKESTVESSSELSAPPPKSNLVFESSKWHDSKLASAVLFLKQFCKEVNTEKFSGKISSKSYVDLSRVCSSVYYTLDSVTRSLIPRYGPGSVSKRIETPGDLYENALRPEKFDVYAKWLKKNIQNIIKSYKKMLKESAKLTEEQLKTETSRGPLKYGFVYKGDWWSMSLGSADMVTAAVSEIQTFSKALKSLQKRLDDVLKKNAQKDSTVVSQPSVSAPKSALVFENSKWDDSMLASTFLFINEFCKEVKARKFNEHIPDKKFKDLSEKCNDVSSFVGSFSWRRVRGLDGNPYKDALKPEKFKDYSKWLKKHYPEIEKSIKNIKNEALKLTEKQLETGAPSGLSKYGFVCNGDPNGKILYRWPSQDYRAYFFMDELENLKKLIVKIL